MGSATVLKFYEVFLMNQKNEYNVKAVVADSPFQNFIETVENKMAGMYVISWFKTRITNSIVKASRERLGYDMNEMTLFKDIDEVNNKIPIILLGSREDQLTPFEGLMKVANKIKGPKTVIETKGPHNQQRLVSTMIKVQDILFGHIGMKIEVERGLYEAVQPEDLGDIKSFIYG